MSTKHGSFHLESLRDGRQVYVDGQLVEDVTRHPAFRRSARSVAALYDYQADPENLEKMTFRSGRSERRINRCWQLPTGYEELVLRRRALEAWAECTCGFLGRSPDHVASCLSGMYMGLDVFQEYDSGRASALYDYYHYARDQDLFLTYVIVNPQTDRAVPEEDGLERIAVHIQERDSQGLIVSGAKMLGTATIFSNEVLVASIQPLQPGEEACAVTFAIPVNTPGLKVLSRKSYEQSAGSVFDYPLSSRWDENDALLYFDEVRVPWERVFVDGNIEMSQKQFHSTPAHVFQNYQAQVRLSVKLCFLLGLAARMADFNEVSHLSQVRETLGQLSASAALVEGLVRAMETSGETHGDYYVPNRHLLYAAQVLTQDLYPRFVTSLRSLAGGALIMLPSSLSDLKSPETLRYVRRTQSHERAEERVKFFKLAWDAIGSEFASRHLQYEMFYAGAGYVTRGHAYRTCDWSKASALVDRVLDSYTSDPDGEKGGN